MPDAPEGSATEPEQQQDASQDYEAKDEAKDLPEPVREVLNKERKAAREAEKRARAAEAKAQEYEDRDKSEQEKLAERAAAAEGDAFAAEQKYLRLKVGTEKGLSPALAERLQGTTEEEMVQDAERLLAAVKPKGSDDFDGGARQPAPAGDMNSILRRAAGRA